MFATLLGALPRPPLDQDAPADALVDAALRVQEAAGLEPLTDGGLRGDIPTVEAWLATAARTPGAVKQAVPGPVHGGARRRRHARGRWGRHAEPGRRGQPAPAPAGRRRAAPSSRSTSRRQPSIADDEQRALFREAHLRLLDGLDGTHPSLALTGGSADAAGIDTILAAPYASLAVDLIAGPDNWRLVALVPGDLGIVCGALSVAPGSDDGPELLLWAAGYAASMRGRGPDRVGLATASSLAHLSWDAAVAKIERLGAAARLAVGPLDDQLAAFDPRAVSSRAAALGRVEAAGRNPLPKATIRLDSGAARCHHPTTSPRHPEPAGVRIGGHHIGVVTPSPARSLHRRRRFMPVSEHIEFVVNGTPRELDVEPRRLLVQALREDLDLTGTHVGCDTSQCGACTVHVDGRAVKSCTMLAVQADGADRTHDRGPRER